MLKPCTEKRKHAEPGTRATYGLQTSHVALGKSLDSFEPLLLNHRDDHHHCRSVNGLMNSMTKTDYSLVTHVIFHPDPLFKPNTLVLTGAGDIGY